MEYWRTKRLEPRVIRLIRRGTIAFSDLIQASEAARSRVEKLESGRDLETRIATLEIGLGKFVRGIEVATSIIGGLVLVEESREEAGVYDKEAKLVHRNLGGGANDRVPQLEEMLTGNMLLLQALLVVLENTDMVRNVIVCTLCSCYPYELLGNPPWWYKHDSYKQEIVTSPKTKLKEMFKLAVPPSVEVRVYDSTSDIRYMVLPRRPDGTEGMSEEQLGRLVTQESLIGVGDPLIPD